MIRYHVTALGLKCFSSCKPARSLYRALGNSVGNRKRAAGSMPSTYFERAQRNFVSCLKYAPLRENDLVLEIGTGWAHWEALTLRLFFDFKAFLYDVWDNRQLAALKSFVRQLETRFGQDGFLEGCDFDRARALIKKIEGVTSFDELYGMLGFRYVLDPDGLMEGLPRNAFRLAISAGVLEHIPAATAPKFISNMASLLVPGGLAIHGINISDHLSMHDPSASPKQYLTYSERRWKLLYENRVQYINRIQRSEWTEMFASAGLNVIQQSGSHVDLTGLKVHPQFHDLTREDIDCTTVFFVARKD